MSSRRRSCVTDRPRSSGTPRVWTASCQQPTGATVPAPRPHQPGHAPRSASVLPPELTSFVGRDRGRGRRCRGAGEARLVTLTGVGGVGKTRLAMRAAAASGPFADGVSWCELAPVTDPSAASAAVATALGVRRSAETGVVESVVDFLSLRRHAAGPRQLRAPPGRHPTLGRVTAAWLPTPGGSRDEPDEAGSRRRARPPRRAAAGAPAIGSTRPRRLQRSPCSSSGPAPSVRT